MGVTLWQRLSLRAKGLVVIAIPLATCLAAWWAVSQLRGERAAARAFIVHSLEVRETVHRTLTALLDAEAGAMQWIQAGAGAADRGAGARYRSARATLALQVDRLESLVADNPSQRALAARVRALESRDLAELDAILEGGERGGARGRIADHAGVPMAMRAALDAMLMEEQHLLERREQAEEQRVRLRARPLIDGALAAGFLGSLVAILLLTTDITRRARRTQEAALALASGHPSLQPVDPSRDAIGDIARSLVEAGRLLADREAALSESRERYRTIAREFPNGLVIVLDAELRFQLMDGEGLAQLGLDPAGYLGRRLGDSDPPPEGDYLALCERALQGESIAASQLARRRALELRMVPLRDGAGRVTGILATTQDVTDRAEAARLLVRRQAELEAANGELEAFSYSVSHDLRAPLRGIAGFSQALLEDYEGALDETGRDYLRRVRAAAQRMGQLIDDLLILSRASRQPLSREAVDVGAMAAEIFAGLARSSPERSVQVTLAPDLVTRADPRLLRILLENLCGNAWKFTSGRADAAITLGREEGTDLLCLADNGAGFDMQLAGRMFSPFQRLHTDDQFPGTGIGLAIARRIVLRHGGRITAEGAPGRGARFLFSLGG